MVQAPPVTVRGILRRLGPGLIIAGSIVANYLGKLLGFYQTGEAAGFIMSVIGAGLLMMIFKAVSK